MNSTDTKSVVERLRNLGACEPGCEGRCDFCPDEAGREAADLIERLSTPAPVDGELETTAELREHLKTWAANERQDDQSWARDTVAELLRDHDRLTALLAAEKVEATAAWAIVANRDAALATSEAARVKAVEALRQQNHTASEMLRDLGRADLARCFEPAITEGTIP